MGIDPVGFKESNPIMFNRYAYANNNPYKFTDPNGKNAIEMGVLGSFAFTGIAVGLSISSMSPEQQAQAAATLSNALNSLGGFISGMFNETPADQQDDPDKDGRDSDSQTRGEKGKDGGISSITTETVDGDTTSVRHTVKTRDVVVHDHIDHKGKNKTSKQFSDELTGVDTIGHKDGSKDNDPYGPGANSPAPEGITD